MVKLFRPFGWLKKAVLLPFLGTLISFFIISPNIPNWYEVIYLLLIEILVENGSIVFGLQKEIKKPNWYPPDNLCLFLGLSMYVPIGIASYLIYRDGGGFDGPARQPLILYAVQLILAWIWPFIFFQSRSLKWVFK